MKKKILLAGLLFSVLFACAPVLNRELMREGLRDVPLSEVRHAPDSYKGKLFILGGMIVDTKHTENGTQIEAVAVRVNRLGYLRDEVNLKDGRFLAIYPAEQGYLEPLVYKRGREITLAGEFLEIRKAKLDDVDYAYPVFMVKQIYLWDEYRRYPAYPYYYPSAYPYGWYDPWYGPWYGPGWWWSFDLRFDGPGRGHGSGHEPGRGSGPGPGSGPGAGAGGGSVYRPIP